MTTQKLTYDDFLGRLHSLVRIVPVESKQTPGVFENFVDPFDETTLADQLDTFDEFHSTECLLNRVCIDNAIKHGKPFIDSVLIHNDSCSLCRNYIGGATRAN